MSDYDNNNNLTPDGPEREPELNSEDEALHKDEQSAGYDDVGGSGEKPPYNEPPFNANPYSQGYNPYNAGSSNQFNHNYEQQFNYPPAGGGYQGYNNNNYYNHGSGNSASIKKRRRGVKVFFSILLSVVILAGAVVGGFLIRGNGNNNLLTQKETTTQAISDDTQLNIVQTPEDDNSSAAVEGALTPVQIAEKVKPSVVGIIVYSNSTGGVVSEGSGIIMSEDSGKNYTYIITCAHVISQSGISVSVQFSDKKTYDAEIVGFDTRTDVGVVKIKATGLPKAEFGNSNNLKVGESVYAIGNPGGTEFFGSFTAGMVSAIDRSITSTYTMKCIQHDAAINPGNSGGALVNVFGQVIGINSIKIADMQYEGMGFAIPISDAKSVIDNLIKFGYVPDRPMLGIRYSEVSASQQYSMIVQIKGLPAGSLIIMEIDKTSSLANTDARQYDMIIAVDGKELTTPDVLLDRIDNCSVGDTLTLTLCRISNNYEINNFDIKVKLIEDKGSTSAPEEETTKNIFDFFQNPFGS
ncbi:MAG: trypsin-like serine protease [Clostridiales bacterium]|nr:trypsin-like serine protease [Clostridiales bacterium]